MVVTIAINILHFVAHNFDKGEPEIMTNEAIKLFRFGWPTSCGLLPQAAVV